MAERSKFEEDRELNQSFQTLRMACNRLAEGLLTRAIRQLEAASPDARGMLSVLKYESIDKVWKAVMEGPCWRRGWQADCG